MLHGSELWTTDQFKHDWRNSDLFFHDNIKGILKNRTNMESLINANEEKKTQEKKSTCSKREHMKTSQICDLFNFIS